jgi:hypothetical protein
MSGHSGSAAAPFMAPMLSAAQRTTGGTAGGQPSVAAALTGVGAGPLLPMGGAGGLQGLQRAAGLGAGAGVVGAGGSAGAGLSGLPLSLCTMPLGAGGLGGGLSGASLNGVLGAALGGQRAGEQLGVGLNAASLAGLGDLAATQMGGGLGQALLGTGVQGGVLGGLTAINLGGGVPGLQFNGLGVGGGVNLNLLGPNTLASLLAGGGPMSGTAPAAGKGK